MFYKIKQAHAQCTDTGCDWAANRMPVIRTESTRRKTTFSSKRNEEEKTTSIHNMKRIKFLICHKLCYIMLLKGTHDPRPSNAWDVQTEFMASEIILYVCQETSDDGDANHRFNLMNSLRLNLPFCGYVL